MTLRLTGLTRYPVKSCRGEDMTSAAIEPWGLHDDRRWMLIDSDGEAATAREHPVLLLARPQLVADGVLIAGPHADPLHVVTPGGPPIAITVHGRGPYPVNAADAAAHDWFSALVGAPLRLVHQPDPSTRPVNPRFGAADDRVSLADAYPMLLTSEESLAALNTWIAAGALAHEGPLPMRRFRPNLVLAGAPAWDEDGWRRIRIGEATFRVVTGCDRCVLTTTDPETATRGKEPIATLARYRRWDGATWFGMNVIPDSPGARLNVGDDVEILAAEPAPDGPPR